MESSPEFILVTRSKADQEDAYAEAVSACDREPVQFPDAIQPHGVLLVVRCSDLLITAASENTGELFGQPVQSILGKHLQAVLPDETVNLLVNYLRDAEIHEVPRYLGESHLLHRTFKVSAHQVADDLIVEFELADKESSQPAGLYNSVRSYIRDLYETSSIPELLSVAVRQIRELTGFDRVLAYQFLPDGTGKILAEEARSGLQSFMGLHFPPGDVPAPARRVLSLLWVRYQPDVAYEPVPIRFAERRKSALDLSRSFLRSTSAMCNRYYQNLGVLAKVVITIKREGDLWGSFICQNEQPKHVSHERRLACETVAHSVSLSLRAKEALMDAHEESEARRRVELLIDRMTESSAWQLPLADGLQDCLQVGGVGALIDGSLLLRGVTPTESQVERLVAWLDTLDHASSDFVFSTSNLSLQWQSAEEFRSQASGLLAARLDQGEYLLWFRPEQPFEISWAGDPEKPVRINEENGKLQVAPRTSFTLQRRFLQGFGQPWKDYEIGAVKMLRRAARRIHKIDRLNRQLVNLEAANSDLESITQIASHDLKEPLRGIKFTSEMLSLTLGDTIPASELTQLDSIGRMADRMNMLLTALLQSSRAQRLQIQLQSVDMNELVRVAVETASSRLAGCEVRIVHSLPAVECDSTLMTQVFINLIVNGIKYNESAQKLIEIGMISEPEPSFFVRDNGIGIPPASHQEIFKPFRRLHGREEFGGGAGAGLAIVQKIIEQHGGRIWVESRPGAGSTFFFTLPQQERREPAGATLPANARRSARAES